jgi:hypothetical protein
MCGTVSPRTAENALSLARCGSRAASTAAPAEPHAGRPGAATAERRDGGGQRALRRQQAVRDQGVRDPGGVGAARASRRSRPARRGRRPKHREGEQPAPCRGAPRRARSAARGQRRRRPRRPAARHARPAPLRAAAASPESVADAAGASRLRARQRAPTCADGGSACSRSPVRHRDGGGTAASRRSAETPARGRWPASTPSSPSAKCAALASSTARSTPPARCNDAVARRRSRRSRAAPRAGGGRRARPHGAARCPRRAVRHPSDSAPSTRPAGPGAAAAASGAQRQRRQGDHARDAGGGGGTSSV